MPSSSLIQYVYLHRLEESHFQRAQNIVENNRVKLIEHNKEYAKASLQVEHDTNNMVYKVFIEGYNQDPPHILCTCPYNRINDICIHKIAAALFLDDLLEKEKIQEQEKVSVGLIKLSHLSMNAIEIVVGKQQFEEAKKALRKSKLSIVDAKDNCLITQVVVCDKKEKVDIRRIDKKHYQTACTCKESNDVKMCIHKTIVFLHIIKNLGVDYFDSIRNWEVTKERLLNAYGYSLKDDLKGKFEFSIWDNKISLRVLDSSIKKIEVIPEVVPEAIVSKKAENLSAHVLPKTKEFDSIDDDKIPLSQQLGVVWVEQALFPFFKIQAVKGHMDDATNSEYVDSIQLLDITKYLDEELSEKDAVIFTQLRKFSAIPILQYIRKKFPIVNKGEEILQYDETTIKNYLSTLTKYYFVELSKVFFTYPLDIHCFFLPKGKKLTHRHLQPISLISEKRISPEFVITATKAGATIECKVKLLYEKVSYSANELRYPFLFLYKQQLFMWKEERDIQYLEIFEGENTIHISNDKWESFIVNWLIPANQRYIFSYIEFPMQEIKDVDPRLAVQLEEEQIEDSTILVFKLRYLYESFLIDMTECKDEVFFPSIGFVTKVYRKKNKEQVLVDHFLLFHDQFKFRSDTQDYYLEKDEVLHNNWFVTFCEDMDASNMDILGLDDLEEFRFNKARPITKIAINNSFNKDMFSAKMSVQFNEYDIPLENVIQALENSKYNIEKKNNKKSEVTIKLPDGSMGLLSKEWINKYATILTSGNVKGSHVELNKYQFNIIDDLYSKRDGNEHIVEIELQEKYKKLKEDYTIKPIAAPITLASILRPYQLGGFQWLNFLYEKGFGGILADDMGLGKTIQSLTFIQHIKQLQEQIKVLVICPNTLLFNWQNEIKKFTPSLTSFIYHGNNRQPSSMSNIDIVLTTYGTLRSDIKSFLDLDFDCIILDESQAIKNPESKVTKAVSLLKGKAKFCLSGTPLQNNTFDIFAQMNFVNPLLLKNLSFFRQEFAIPIDKFGDQTKKTILRKQIFPYILRRTKEQVAKDLPEKQEMVIYCEMGSLQRSIYNNYRNMFRTKIMGEIEQKGIQKSQLTVLQGLMKLRQICDSPIVLRENIDEVFEEPVSIKLEELERQIEENMGNHKALVFSQFRGMLALIKRQLTDKGIDFEYFDGSTSTTQREQAIHRFQNEDSCRVFLISLKAGGIGLNLTAADYVYIVDPWWNPAVEAQAIDRTHRIGQTKNIFAYRMICTNTVEERIIQLQARKKVLAQDLISEEDGFVKGLTKEDIDFLFG